MSILCSLIQTVNGILKCPCLLYSCDSSQALVLTDVSCQIRNKNERQWWWLFGRFMWSIMDSSPEWINPLKPWNGCTTCRTSCGSLKILEGMNFSAFLCICETFIWQVKKNTQKSHCNTFQSPSPAIKGSAALIVYLLTCHIWISCSTACCQCSSSTGNPLVLYVTILSWKLYEGKSQISF